jgi:transposase-like protein
MKRQIKSKFELKERRIFSEELKRQVVKELVGRRTTMRSVMDEHQVSAQSVYKWLYKYSPQHQPKCTLVVQMKSEATKNQELQKRIAELERIVGQKQLELDFLNKLIEIGSKELEFDFKKNFSPKLSNGTGSASDPTDTG